MSKPREFNKGMRVRDAMNGYVGTVTEVETDHCSFITLDGKTHRVLRRNLTIFPHVSGVVDIPFPGKSAPIEADKELDEILSSLEPYSEEEVLTPAETISLWPSLQEAKTALLAWRDKAVVAELNRIWRTAVDNNVAGPVKWEIEDRLSKLKAIMEIKEL